MTEAAESMDATPLVPSRHDLESLRKAAAACDACPLYRSGTQTVFGEGPHDARLMLVGEQPGDQEDLSGRPFVGPAGDLLSRALEEAEVERAAVYVTNAVKHFKWEPRGKRRLHKKPSSREVGACIPWLEAEVDAVGPELIVALGATAGQALLGRDFRVTRDRGQLLTNARGWAVTATLHPSALLRQRDPDLRAAQYRGLVADLRQAGEWARGRA